MTQTYKCGTRIEVKCLNAGFEPTWEPATIATQPKNGYAVVGYWAVEFARGGRLAVHESMFRTADKGEPTMPTKIDYAATADRAFAAIYNLADQHDGNAQALAIHARNYREAAQGIRRDGGETDQFFRQGERFLRARGLLAEVQAEPAPLYRTYEITAAKCPVRVCYGTEAEAVKYCSYLNQYRKSDLYAARVLTDEEEKALGVDADWYDLGEELRAIAGEYSA